MDVKGFFAGKKITIMGVDPNGRGIRDAKFAGEHGAELLLTDIKDTHDIRNGLQTLMHLPNIQYRLGAHVIEDFVNTDLVIRASEAPIGSPYLKAATDAGVRIETDETLFLALAPHLVTIGVTGTRGKTTTTHLIYEILKAAHGARVHLAGNVRGVAALPMLDTVKDGDDMVFELASWQLQQFGLNKIALNVAVFTTFMDDHLNYYKGDRDAYLNDKAQIFLHQTPEDTLVVSTQALPILKEKYGSKIKSKLVVANPAKFPKDWTLKMPGEHNVLNAVCAIEATRALGIDEEIIKSVVENFTGVPGRLELVKEVNGIKFYNDTTATTPDATLAALQALGTKNTILIMGGADKGLDMSKLEARLPELKKVVRIEQGLIEALNEALAASTAGDIILFSPAYASFGMFKNEFDRGDQFTELVQKLA
jgi:UDP-N-acetylmuramoylalanine--D-glutamate ligase